MASAYGTSSVGTRGWSRSTTMRSFHYQTRTIASSRSAPRAFRGASCSSVAATPCAGSTTLRAARAARTQHAATTTSSRCTCAPITPALWLAVPWPQFDRATSCATTRCARRFSDCLPAPTSAGCAGRRYGWTHRRRLSSCRRVGRGINRAAVGGQVVRKKTPWRTAVTRTMTSQQRSCAKWTACACICQAGRRRVTRASQWKAVALEYSTTAAARTFVSAPSARRWRGRLRMRELLVLLQPLPMRRSWRWRRMRKWRRRWRQTMMSRWVHQRSCAKWTACACMCPASHRPATKACE